MVYLLHFSRPYRDHAAHYLGYTSLPLEERLKRHETERGAKLLRAVLAAGITYQVVRTWEGGRNLEIQLKKRKNGKKLCPICSPKNLKK